MANKFLIESDNFVCSQLRIENIQNILDLLSSSNYYQYDISYCDNYFNDNVDEEETLLTMKISTNNDSIMIKDGDYIVRANEDICVFANIDNVFTYYEQFSGIKLTANNSEDKLKEIVFSKFYNRAQEYKNIYTDFPYASSLDDFIERGKNGFSTSDWYNFHYYFATIMVNMAKKFRDEGSGYNIVYTPLDSSDLNNELFMKHNEIGWNNMLNIIIEGFDGLAGYDDLSTEEQLVVRKNLNKAFDVVKKYYFDFWD